MLTVVKQNKSPKIIRFEDLRIGDVYKDEEGYICIKVSYNCEDNNLTYEYEEEGE